MGYECRNVRIPTPAISRLGSAAGYPMFARIRAGGGGTGPEVGENGRLVGNLDELVTEFRAIGGSLPNVRIFEES